MEIKLNEQEVQSLIKYIGDIPTAYGADLMQFFKAKLDSAKQEAQVEQEAESKQEVAKTKPKK